MFLIVTALAVKLKWTNSNGNVDINNRYFSKLASQYGMGQKAEQQHFDNEENLLLQKIGLLAKYKPIDAVKISAAYGQNQDLGFEKSKPRNNPQVGGSSFKVGDKDYTFGGLCFEFYYSGELMKDFPLTRQPFTAVAELEKRNEAHLERVKKAIEVHDSIQNNQNLSLPLPAQTYP